MMVVNKSQFSDPRSCGLETKSWVLLVWDQDKTKYKCGRDRDKTKSIKKWSQDQDRSRVLQHYF